MLQGGSGVGGALKGGLSAVKDKVTGKSADPARKVERTAEKAERDAKRGLARLCVGAEVRRDPGARAGEHDRIDDPAHERASAMLSSP